MKRSAIASLALAGVMGVYGASQGLDYLAHRIYDVVPEHGNRDLGRDAAGKGLAGAGFLALAFALEQPRRERTGRCEQRTYC